MGAFVAAGQRVELAPKKLTWLETIQFGNTTGRPVKSNSFWNRVLLDKDERGRFKDVPEEVRANWPFYTGTFAAIGAKGRPLGVKLEAECEFRGSRKTVVAMFDAEEAALVDTMVTCDHGLAPDKTLFLAPVNARTEKPIRTDEEVGEADTILLSLKGQKRRYRIQNRDGGVLEAVGDENTFSWIADQATLGLLGRFYVVGGRLVVVLFVLPSGRRGVVTDASEAGAPPVEVGASQLTILRQSDGELIVRGTKEQLDAAVRLLDQVGK